MRLTDLFFEWWWVAGLAILCLGIYEQGAKVLEKEIALFQHQADDLRQKTVQARALQAELKLQVTSQSDPAWIELVLIKNIGLVPEGYKKIYVPSEIEQ
ncbi:MAG: hypothetical protein JSR46_03620 [Verrucomicrobia bacterium]|nr:hypothetical protein [Verrucomicrobiota bacterium]